MSAEVRLRCDAVIEGEACDASLVLVATSAVVAREDALDRGWTTRRSSTRHATSVKDLCPRCTQVFAIRNAGVRA